MIAYLINELNIRGGTHKQLLKLLDYTERQGESFFIVAKDADFDKTYPGFAKYKDRIRLIGDKKGWGWFRQMRILRKMAKQADCINIHDGGFAAYLPAFRGRRVIWQINDLPGCFQVGVASGAKLSLKKRLARLYLNICKRYVTDFTVNVSKNRDRVRAGFQRDAHVFYCGIEPVCIIRNVEASLERFRNREIHLLSSGVFYPYRNYETQVEVIDKLRKRGINATLKIIGSTADDVYADKVRAMISDRGLDAWITICGQVDDITFQQLHADADVFLFINIDQSWGLAVFEAMSCKLPVFVSNSIGATEILTDRTNAIFVEPTDSDSIVTQICELMQQEQIYRHLCQTVGDFHQRFGWDDAYCSKMLQLLLSKN